MGLICRLGYNDQCERLRVSGQQSGVRQWNKVMDFCNVDRQR